MSLWKSKKGPLKHISQSNYKIHFFKLLEEKVFSFPPYEGSRCQKRKSLLPDFLCVGKKSFLLVFRSFLCFWFFCLFAVGGDKWPDVLSKSVRKFNFFCSRDFVLSQIWSLHKVHTKSKILRVWCFSLHRLAEFSTVIVLISSFFCPSASERPE